MGFTVRLWQWAYLLCLVCAMVGYQTGWADASKGRGGAAGVHVVAPGQWEVSQREDVQAQVTDLEDGQQLTLISNGLQEPAFLTLGWMPVEPETEYEVRYKVRAEQIAEPASLYLMIREHTARGARPIQPYHRTSVRWRAIEPAQAGQWIERAISFTTGSQTHVLSGTLVVLALSGQMHLQELQVVDAAVHAEHQLRQAEEESRALMAEIRAQADAREPLVERTLVYSRSQMKYGLERNYYHAWTDRPLLVNRAFRQARDGYIVPQPSYERIMRAVADYDIDGLAFFPETKDRMKIFELHQKADVSGMGLLPEFLSGLGEQQLEVKKQIIREALANPYSPRIDGKVLITSYGAGSRTPQQWGEALAALRKDVGDTFLFLPALTGPVGLRGAFTRGEPITREQVEVYRHELRKYLEVCDGIYFNYPAAFRKPDRTFDREFYRDIYIPVFKSVLSEPAYQGKYLGLSAYRSHMNQDRGNTLHEDFTRTVRWSFEAAMDARPDVIILPEWDEFNENTSFRPTVYGGTTTMRILRYYMSRIKGIDPTPVPGDDVSIPNLIVSTRKILTLGEVLTVELLNVPDSRAQRTYRVHVTLGDESGREIYRFDPVTMQAAEMQEHRLTLPTEAHPQVQAYLVRVRVEDDQGQLLMFDHGLHAVQVRATWNWDYMSVRQPLRDVLQLQKAELDWMPAKGEGGSRLVTGSVVSPEPIALVELLGDDDEAYAVDPRDEFRRATDDYENILISYRARRSPGSVPFVGDIALHHASGNWISRGTVLHQPAVDSDVTCERVRIRGVASVHERGIYLSIPREQVSQAELAFSLEGINFTVAVRDVIEQQMMGWAFDNGVYVTLSPYRRQFDMPEHLEQREVSFQTRIWPEIATEQYHLRVTSVSGKVYRSSPLVMEPGDSATRLLRIFSDTQQQAVDVQVSADRVPNLVYDFQPQRGAVLLTEAGRPFWASLGKFTSTTTGRGTLHALFRRYDNDVPLGAPQWVEKQGQAALAFDGQGSHLTLPREAIPRRGAFTLSFQVLPSDERDQYLLVNRIVSRTKGLVLQIRNGKLHGSFRDDQWRTHTFATDLAIPPGQWSTVQVRHDLEQIIFQVNDAQVAYPLPRPAVNIAFTVVGEAWRGNWFKGYIRDLRIVHNAR